MIKAVFFDIDGTTVSHSLRDVPKSTRLAIHKLKEKGIQCIIATGRHITEIKELPIKDIKFDGYVTLNGQLCLDSDENVIFSDPIKGNSKDNLIKIFTEKKHPIALVEKDKMYINYVNELVETIQKAISSRIPDTDNYMGNDIYFAVGYFNPDIRNEISKLIPDCHLTNFHECGVDIYPKSSDKVIGIKQYLEINNLKKEEIMAFGDGENDIDMLRFAGIGIAMGNAHEEAKKASDYVTDHIDEDGVYNALRHYKILD